MMVGQTPEKIAMAREMDALVGLMMIVLLVLQLSSNSHLQLLLHPVEIIARITISKTEMNVLSDFPLVRLVQAPTRPNVPPAWIPMLKAGVQANELVSQDGMIATQAMVSPECNEIRLERPVIMAGILIV